MKVHLTDTVPLINSLGIDTQNTIAYPRFAFAFNPICVKVKTLAETSVMLSVKREGEDNPIEITRETFKANGENNVYFDLSAVARSLFDRTDFHKSLDWDIEPLVEDRNLLKKLSFSIKIGGDTFSDFSIPVVWGAMQIGERYSAQKNLKMFRGYPFAVPFFFMEKAGQKETMLSVREDNGAWSERKAVAEGKHYLMTGGAFMPQKRLTLWVDNSENDSLVSTFDYTFDYTFRGLSENSFVINVDVLDTCRNDKNYYLRWINAHGEYCFWLFNPQVESTKVENQSAEFDQYYTTVDFSDNYHVGTGKSVGKKVEKTVQLYADFVDSADFDFLMGLVQSPVVDLYMGNVEGSDKWMSVNIQPATFPKGKEHLQDFSFILEYPRTQIQSL